VKKGRHRRFEEARKLKQTGPDFLFAEPSPAPDDHAEEPVEDDEYADIAARYGAFDDDEDDADDDDR
jgi:hypothetical protein